VDALELHVQQPGLDQRRDVRRLRMDEALEGANKEKAVFLY
jgi:hypothetical protein